MANKDEYLHFPSTTAHPSRLTDLHAMPNGGAAGRLCQMWGRGLTWRQEGNLEASLSTSPITTPSSTCACGRRSEIRRRRDCWMMYRSRALASVTPQRAFADVFASVDRAPTHLPFSLSLSLSLSLCVCLSLIPTASSHRAGRTQRLFTCRPAPRPYTPA